MLKIYKFGYYIVRRDMNKYHIAMLLFTRPKWSLRGFSQFYFHKVDNFASGSSYKTLKLWEIHNCINECLQKQKNLYCEQIYFLVCKIIKCEQIKLITCITHCALA